ncbi:MAG: hypothetical protein JO316_25500 [Abitibacteriaceae bacterium]|nr:hypothetical protein [Abditibacteriaceae bacterium]
MAVELFLGIVVVGLALISGFGLFAGTLLSALDRFDNRATQRRDAQAQEIAQHSVTVAVD